MRLPEASKGGPFRSARALSESCWHIFCESWGLGGGAEVATGRGVDATGGCSSTGRGVEDHGEHRMVRLEAADIDAIFSSAAALEATARSCDMVLGARIALRSAAMRSAL